MKYLQSIQLEISSYSKIQKKFLLFALICGFFITAEYAVTKPITNSIFLTHYGSSYYPYAWLIAVPINFFIVKWYSKCLHHLGPLKILGINAVVTICFHFFVYCFGNQYHLLIFALYIWKDIYVLLMFQQVWSLIHTHSSFRQAKYLYGILFGGSGLGTMVGSLIPSLFAVKLGSEVLLLVTMPLYICLYIFYQKMLQTSNHIQKVNDSTSIPNISSKGGFSLLRSSPTLLFILAIVVLMQLSVTLLDYQFNYFLESTLPNQDIRTQFYSRLLGKINIAKLCLQFFVTFFLVRWVGLKKSHVLIPLILLMNGVFVLLLPSFFAIAYSFGAIKVFDYSVFNILKEMLYVPLSKEEKFKAKAVIDIFAYRSSKAFASCIILIIGGCFSYNLWKIYLWIFLLICVTWLLTVVFYFRSQELQSKEFA